MSFRVFWNARAKNKLQEDVLATLNGYQLGRYTILPARSYQVQGFSDRLPHPPTTALQIRRRRIVIITATNSNSSGMTARQRSNRDVDVLIFAPLAAGPFPPLGLDMSCTRISNPFSLGRTILQIMRCKACQRAAQVKANDALASETCTQGQGHAQ